MNKKTYQEATFADKARACLQQAKDDGLLSLSADATEKFVADCAADMGRASKRGGVSVTGTLFRTVESIPASILKDYPRLVSMKALEAYFLARLAAEAAGSAIDASAATGE
jgi:hypothetical protein